MLRIYSQFRHSHADCVFGRLLRSGLTRVCESKRFLFSYRGSALFERCVRIISQPVMRIRGTSVRTALNVTGHWSYSFLIRAFLCRYCAAFFKVYGPRFAVGRLCPTALRGFLWIRVWIIRSPSPIPCPFHAFSRFSSLLSGSSYLRFDMRRLCESKMHKSSGAPLSSGKTKSKTALVYIPHFAAPHANCSFC
jgi:hypothetical protein